MKCFLACVVGGKIEFEGMPFQFRLSVQRRKKILGIGLVYDAL